MNPPRKDGGTSSIEALAEGKPVITYPYYDVAYSVGDAFICNSEDEMILLLDRYNSDSEFYESQQKIGYQRVLEVTDTESVLDHVLKNIVWL